MKSNLPPEFQPLLDELADTPENVKAMWRYAIALLLIDDEKARILETREEGDTQHLTVETISGDRFEVVRPPMSEAVEQELLEQLRAFMAGEE